MQQRYYRTGERAAQPHLVIIAGRDRARGWLWESRRFPYHLNDPKLVVRMEADTSNITWQMDEVESAARHGAEIVILAVTRADEHVVRTIRRWLEFHQNWNWAVEWRAFEYLDEKGDHERPYENEGIYLTVERGPERKTKLEAHSGTNQQDLPRRLRGIFKHLLRRS